MKISFKIIFCVCAVSALSVVADKAEKCVKDQCDIANNCRCSSIKSPLAEGTAPQLIALTFDEAVTNDIFNRFWQSLLYERKNPDGNPISGTFFVPHEYSDYRRVQELYLKGFEIGVNSITKNSLSEYWKTASIDTLKQEFGGQRTLLAHFANIPKEDVIGARTPQLQIEGDTSIEAYIESGIQYDSSWTTRSISPLFPYTLDYLSTQECRSGTTCPTESHPGFWIQPIINLQGNGSVECNALITCNFEGTADEIAKWLNDQVERIRNHNRAPMTIMVSAAYFEFVENSFEGFKQFLDGLGDDVFLVSQRQVIDWIKNPVPVEQFQTEVPSRTAECNPVNCYLQNTAGEIRYMMSCVPCPDVYPWLGNPLGLLDPNATTTTITTPTTTTPEPTTTTEATTTTTTTTTTKQDYY